MTPGDNLRKYRILAGHSLKSLAEVTGISEGTLTAWELNPGRLKQRDEKHVAAVRIIVECLNKALPGDSQITEDHIWRIVARADEHGASNTIDRTLMADIAILLARVGFSPSTEDDLAEDAKELLSRVAKFK